MVDVKAELLAELREVREVMLAKLDGLGEYDVRRPLTATGTNLLGLVKHLAVWESRYLGEVFGRPFPGSLPRWDDVGARGSDLWAAAGESRDFVVGLYRRVWVHADATVSALSLDAVGYVPWWPRPDASLFSVLMHRVVETNRHAGHADILRESLDGVVGVQRDAGFWVERREVVERAAREAAG